MAEFKQQREAMVSQQLWARGIHDERVLAAMQKVPREWFVLPEQRDASYADRALPIGCDQTISQPYMVALMTQELTLSGDERVLEIGTGSGYQTAVLAELCAEVYTIERIRDLSLRARSILDARGYENVHFLIGDGSKGWPEQAPFDRILTTAMAPEMPRTLFAQLSEGGVLVIPLGNEDRQMLQQIRKQDGKPVVRDVCACMFVKLIGGEGWLPEVSD